MDVLSNPDPELYSMREKAPVGRERRMWRASR